MKKNLIKFFKYTAYGNDYIVIDPKFFNRIFLSECDIYATPWFECLPYRKGSKFVKKSEIDHREKTQRLLDVKDKIKAMCDRNFGIGSDGILLGPLFCDSINLFFNNLKDSNLMSIKDIASSIDKINNEISIWFSNSNNTDFKNQDKNSKNITIGKKIPFLRIFNSDGSEAEKSGNGLRIFSQYLKDSFYLKNLQKFGDKYLIITAGGLAEIKYEEDDFISISMGKAYFNIKNLDIKLPDYISKELKDDLALDIPFEFEGFKLLGNFCSVGNPHCVFFVNNLDEQFTRNYGSKIENHIYFPCKTNVQFVKVIDRKNISIQIYERGSGYTLSSGSSASAAASVAYKKGLVENNVKVHMPGGIIEIMIKDDFTVFQKGKANIVFEGCYYL
ncbi:MAG TPA: diaminopimelate epimerase [Exilispira sp.]|nr:diaminopimelate epimerase [Exilispira sp.]